MDIKLTTIFPTPIVIAKYEKVDSVMDCIKKMPPGVLNEKGNHLSATLNILDDPGLSHLKEFILECLKEYAKKILDTSAELYITQSWINRSPKGVGHHEHAHSNSIVSGVLHITKGEKLPPIRFSKDSFDSLQLPVNKNNIFNSPYSMFNFEAGNLVLFPSSLRHAVPVNESDHVRYSIAFNTFTKSLGEKLKLNLTEL